MTLAAPRPRQTARLPRWLVGIAIMAALIGLGKQQLDTNNHSIEAHGADAARIHKCLEENGPDQVWQDTTRPNIRIFVCKLPCSRWGILIAQITTGKSQCDYIERTAFVPGKGAGQGMWDTVWNYLDGFAKVIK